MSDIINELQESFEDTNKQLSKLSADLNKLTKFEDNLSKAGDSLEEASDALRKTSENHSDFIENAKELNSSIEVIAKTVGKLEPKEIIKAQNDQKDKLDEISSQFSEEIKAFKNDQTDKLDEISSQLSSEIETLKTEINTLKESNAKSLDEIMSKATSASRIRLLNLLVLIGVAGLLFLSVAPKFL